MAPWSLILRGSFRILLSDGGGLELSYYYHRGLGFIDLTNLLELLVISLGYPIYLITLLQ